jgi:hypothetical protein
MGKWQLGVELTLEDRGLLRVFEIEQGMSLNLFLQKVKLDQTKSYLKVWNICRNEKFIRDIKSFVGAGNVFKSVSYV